MAGISRRLCVCLLNVSEARRKPVVENIAKSALHINEKSASSELRASVLNIFSDADYNRSVITIAADAEFIGKSVHDACCTAYQEIDLREHEGGHPRLGAVDLVPFHPVSESVTLDECGIFARDVANQLSESVPGMSAFLFGAADLPLRRGLVERRKHLGWFSGKHGSEFDNIQQDIGARPSSRYGCTGIGAIPYVMNCNVTIDTTDVAFGRKIASRIRGTNVGGLPGVQSLAFPHEDNVEIACNVQGVYLDSDSDEAVLIRSFGKCFHVPAGVVEDRVKTIAAQKGISTVGTAIIGFTPKEAENMAIYALTSGQAEFWRTRELFGRM